MRDKINDNEYFNCYIDKQKNRLKFYKNKLPEIDTSKEKIMRSMKNAIFTINFEVIVAKYSKGDDLNLIREEYIEAIPTFREAFSDIIDMNTLQFIALSVLLNVDLFDDEEFLALLDKFEVSHGVIEIFRSKEDVIDINSYKDIKQFRPWVAELYQKPEEREAIISKQLSNWYRSQRSSYFYGYDKAKEPLYFGYWALEIATLVKVLNIPDDSFKNHKYYPYDLVHFGG
ncbi:PoNe immunity protein domain-containing protein [Streptococcus suis]